MDEAFSIRNLTLALDIGERLLVCGAEVSWISANGCWYAARK